MVVGGPCLATSVVFRNSSGGAGGPGRKPRTTAIGPGGTATTTADERPS